MSFPSFYYALRDKTHDFPYSGKYSYFSHNNLQKKNLLIFKCRYNVGNILDKKTCDCANATWYRYIQYMYIVQPVSQRVQINFIFNDNVRILWISCNIKKSKTTKNSWKKRRSNRFQNHICDVSTYTVTISYNHSTGIMNQKS